MQSEKNVGCSCGIAGSCLWRAVLVDFAYVIGAQAGVVAGAGGFVRIRLKMIVATRRLYQKEMWIVNKMTISSICCGAIFGVSFVSGRPVYSRTGYTSRVPKQRSAEPCHYN